MLEGEVLALKKQLVGRASWGEARADGLPVATREEIREALATLPVYKAPPCIHDAVYGTCRKLGCRPK